MVIRCADPVSVFFDTYRNILYQSDISGQDAQSASIPRMFFPVGWKRQPEEGGIGPGCCGGGVITTWAAGDGVIAAGVCCLSRRRVLALPQCFLAVSRSPSSIPRRSPCLERCHLPLASLYTSTSQNPKNIPRLHPLPERCHLPLASLNHIHLSKPQNIPDCLHPRSDATLL